ncbi:MAG: circularly permuted type 2 ATP-grasp protein, partial [Cytophagales bacterium]
SMLFDDLYGARHCIKNGIIPAELIMSHSGFLASLDKIYQKGRFSIPIFASDIARGPDGKMWVINDRCQAPSGMGYALENRLTLLRTFSSMKDGVSVSRISPFFNKFHDLIVQLSESKNPNTALLTPGPNNETYFEHAYLSSYLGFSLVVGDDLISKDGKLWLKSIGGLQKVDAIIRRVDDNYCDPLELKADSQLGVPGLVEVIRRGNLTMLNPLGTGILENNALFAFLPNACKYYLGEDLILSNAATWWCGQKTELDFVLSNIETLLIKKIDRSANFKTIYGKTLSEDGKEKLKKEISERPYQFIGQEEVSFSTTPSWVGNKIEPRFASIRCYALLDKDDYTVMSGGLTRTAGEKNSFFVSNQYGGIAKDTWIVENQTEDEQDFKISVNQSSATISYFLEVLPSRSAENLFWVGRYGERTLQSARFCSTAIKAFLEDPKFYQNPRKKTEISTLLAALTHLTVSYPGFLDGNSQLLKKPFSEIKELCCNESKMGSIAMSVSSKLRSIQNVRDRWSLEIWRTIDLVQQSYQALLPLVSTNQPKNLIQELELLTDRITALNGLITDTMPHTSGWVMYEMGKRIERGLSLCSLMRSLLCFSYDSQTDPNLIEYLLASCHNLIYYRSKYKNLLEPFSVSHLLIMDEKNPHSIIFQTNQMIELLGSLPSQENLNLLQNPLNQKIRLIQSLILQQDLFNLIQTNDLGFRIRLDGFLSTLSKLYAEFYTLFAAQYFSHSNFQQALAPTSNLLKLDEI